jgi:hypothetical protein
MKRKDLVVGQEVAVIAANATYRTAKRAIVVDTKPWRESRAYLGRLGTVGTGRFSPEDRGSGVAVAVKNMSRYRERDEWTPAVVPLSSVRCSWAEYEEQEARNQIARQASAERDRAREIERAQKAAELKALHVELIGSHSDPFIYITNTGAVSGWSADDILSVARRLSELKEAVR